MPSQADAVLAAQWDHITLEGSAGPIKISLLDLFAPQEILHYSRAVDAAETGPSIESDIRDFGSKYGVTFPLLLDPGIIVNDLSQKPTAFIMKPDEVKERAHRREKEGRTSFWLQPAAYDQPFFREHH